MLVSTEELDPITGEDTLIIDARSFGEYSEGHIPGAVNLDLFAFHWIDTTEEGIRSFGRQAEALLSFAGVGQKGRVVFYDNVSGMLAARGVWMLEYFSHPGTSMLDGGMKKWRSEGRPTESSANPFRPSKFSGKINPRVIAGHGYILENIDTLKIIDARSEQEYDGTVPRAARAGHIPKSVNIDWNRNVDSDGTFKSDGELAGLYNIPKDSEIVTYCQGSYRAANAFVALRKLGFHNVRVYLGSWGEWGNMPELPVERLGADD